VETAGRVGAEDLERPHLALSNAAVRSSAIASASRSY
jgi:hypothetical protein